MNKNNLCKILLAFLCLCESKLFSNDLEVVFTPIEKPKKPTHDGELNYYSIFNIPIIKSDKINTRQIGNQKNDFSDYFLETSNPISSFLYSIKNLDSLASSTKLNLASNQNKEFKSYFGFGLHNTLRTASSLNIPIDDSSSLFLATSIDSYEGNFKYEDYQLNKPIAMSRKNNDQHIFKMIAQYNKKTLEQKISASLMSNMHEGGVEGYTYSPLSLRAFNINTGLNSEFEQIIKDTRLNISTSHVFFEQYTSQNLTKNSDFIQSSHEIIAKFEPLNLPNFLTMEFGQKILFEKEYTNSINRLGLGFLMERNMNFNMPLNPNFYAKFDMTGYHQEDLLFNKNFNFSIHSADLFKSSISYIKTGRIPSLLELYGNNAFFVGNKDLESESIFEIALNNNIKAHKMLSFDANFFIDFIKNSILYQPYRGNRLMAVNSSKAKKMATELGFSFTPLSFLTLKSFNEITFYNKIKDTQKALPQNSLLKGISKLIIGKEDFILTTLQTRYQTASFFDVNQRLRIKPYMLVDFLASYKINNNIELSASVENIFNEKGAKNSLYMPISPLSFLAQIHINTL